MKIEKNLLFPTLVFRQFNIESEQNLIKINKFCDDLSYGQTVYHLQNLPLFTNLSKKILDTAKIWMEEFDYVYNSLKITNIWCNKLQKGKYHKPHTHPNNFLSGVYYPNSSETKIVFMDPRVQNKVFIPTRKKLTYLNSPDWLFPIEKNTMIMFPSWLSHYVGTIDKDRVSISFNIMINGDVGKSENFDNSFIN